MGGDVYHQLFELNPAAKLIIDPTDGRIVDASQAACEFYGYEKSELLRRRISDINVLPPHEIAALMGQARHGRREPFHFQHRLASGEVREVEVHSGPFEVDGRTLLCSIVHDVTARLRAEERLRESEELYRFLTESATDMIAQHSVDGRWIFVTEGCRSVVGYEPSELIGRLPFELILPEDVPAVVARRAELLGQGDTATYEFRARHRDGSIVWIETKSRVVRDKDGLVTGTIAVSRNVTERVEARKLAEENARRLEQVQRVESLAVLAGGIAHDFNNLLTVIMAATEDLQRHAANPEAREAADLAHAAAHRAAGLCQKLLAYAGKRRLTAHAVDLSAMIRSDTELLRASIDRRIEIHYELAPSLPAIRGDATALHQVILNLVINAGEAIEGPGHVRITTSARPVTREELDATVTGRDLRAGRYVVLDVEDSGVGMPEEVVSRVFEPFFTTKFKGRGLGLAAVLGIARSHGGTLAVRSRPGEGTRMRVFFPAQDEAGDGPSAELRERPAALTPRTVLVVDDEAPIRSLVSSALEALGHRVLQADEGPAALTLAKATAPDLAIVDVTMPVMSGDTLVVELARQWPTLRFIVMSGHAEEQVRERLVAHESRVVLLPKPFGLGDLERAVSRALT